MFGDFRQQDIQRGTCRLRRKLVWTTLVSVVIFAGCYVVYVERLVILDRLWALFGLHIGH